MGLWGTSAGSEHKPNWLTPAQKENCYATPHGWVLKHANGTEETLVCVRGLSGAARLAAASITGVSFAKGAFARSATKTVMVEFNEKVAVTGTPTVTLTTTGVSGTIVASYSGINANGTVLTFTFTVPAEAGDISVVAQSVALAGGTIVEQAAGALAASLVISAGIAGAAGNKVVA